METLYELRNIEHRYADAPVLTIDVWSIQADAVTGIAGPNGSGKSTLLSLLGLIVAPTQGRIRLFGRTVQPFDERTRGAVALLPQDTFLLKRSVRRNVAYGLKIQGGVAEEDKRVRDAMQMVGLAPERYGARPWYALSGGEARRVALASRLVLKPKVLLMDEPTLSVDAASAQMIKAAALHARRQWGTSLIVSSHDRQWLSDICDTVLLMFRGKILGTGQQTLVFGPWYRTDNGGAATSLDDQQDFVVATTPPDADRSVATIRAERLQLYQHPPASTQSHVHCLKGMLMQLRLDKESRRVLASVLVGSTVFSTHLPPDSIQTCHHMPGQSVWIGYDPTQIAWH